jgi:hypothetical protein
MIKIRRFDPLTLVTTAVAVGGSVLGGIGAKQDADAQAAAAAEQGQRDIRDTEREKSRKLARTKALLAAGMSGSGSAILTSQATEFGIRTERIRSDTANKVKRLKARGRAARASGFLKAINTGVQGVSKAQQVADLEAAGKASPGPNPFNKGGRTGLR